VSRDVGDFLIAELPRKARHGERRGASRAGSDAAAGQDQMFKPDWVKLLQHGVGPQGWKVSRLTDAILEMAGCTRVRIDLGTSAHRAIVRPDVRRARARPLALK